MFLGTWLLGNVVSLGGLFLLQAGAAPPPKRRRGGGGTARAFTRNFFAGKTGGGRPNLAQSAAAYRQLAPEAKAALRPEATSATARHRAGVPHPFGTTLFQAQKAERAKVAAETAEQTEMKVLRELKRAAGIEDSHGDAIVPAADPRAMLHAVALRPLSDAITAMSHARLTELRRRP